MFSHWVADFCGRETLTCQYREMASTFNLNIFNMKKYLYITLTIIIYVFSNLGHTAEIPPEQKPVYFMAQLKIIDKKRLFTEYVPEVKKHIKAGKGRVLFLGKSPAIQLEGEWDYFTVVIEFPSKKYFDLYYYSDGNLNIAIPIRQEVTSTNNTMLFN
jgi:uncharacterized protein (DUF1330 family)